MKTVNPSEFNTEFRFENKWKLTEVRHKLDLVLDRYNMDFDLDELIKRAHTPNLKNHGIRRLGPTNDVPFNGIPLLFIYTVWIFVFIPGSIRSVRFGPTKMVWAEISIPAMAYWVMGNLRISPGLRANTSGPSILFLLYMFNVHIWFEHLTNF